MRNSSAHLHLIPCAYVRQPSGLRLNLLDPDPHGWTDQDLAVGLSRTYRWGGHSIWPLPLSVAQHALTVLAIRERRSACVLTAEQKRRELLHDADEALIGGFDPISPLKPMLGGEYAAVVAGLERAVSTRYGLPSWAPVDFKEHKRADHLAAASEAVHVAGWTTDEIHDLLNIGLKPLSEDPLSEIYDCRPWEPWAPNVAAERFLLALSAVSADASLAQSFKLDRVIS